MATNPEWEPVEDEVSRLLADPAVRARLDAFLDAEQRGELGSGVAHEEVGRRLGLKASD